MITLLIIITVLLIMLFMPIKVQIIRNDKKNDINLYFVKIFNIRFDLDEFFKKLYQDNSKPSLTVIINNIKNLKIYKKLLKELMGMIVMRKSTLCYTSSNIYVSVACWNSIYALRNFLSYHFLRLDNEYYNVSFKENAKTTIEFEFVFFIRSIYFILAYIISVKDIIKNKRKGSVINVGTSNKWFI